MHSPTPRLAPALAGHLLHDLERRQDEVLVRLDQLNAQIEAVLRQWGGRPVESDDLPSGVAFGHDARAPDAGLVEDGLVEDGLVEDGLVEDGPAD
jgi:hypothetical protein